MDYEDKCVQLRQLQEQEAGALGEDGAQRLSKALRAHIVDIKALCDHNRREYLRQYQGYLLDPTSFEVAAPLPSSAAAEARPATQSAAAALPGAAPAAAGTIFSAAPATGKALRTSRIAMDSMLVRNMQPGHR